MIIEDYVSFEVAKLLKEKGFSEKCRAFYNDKTLKISYIDSSINNKKPFNLCLLAPTHQMAMKWLRDEKNIHIKVHCSGNRNYLAYAQSLVTAFHDFCIESATCSFNTYEEAVEEAIKYCLINLIE